MTLASFAPAVSLFLIPLLIAPPGWSQASLSANATGNTALQLKIVDSDGPQIPANSHSSKGLSLQVLDSNGAAVPDAAIAVRLPDSGPSGLFPDGSHSAVVYSDAGGRAHLDGIQWNMVAGTMAIRVTATKGDEHAGLLLEQTLVSGSPATRATAPRLEAAAPLTGSAAPAILAPMTSAASSPERIPSTPRRPAPVDLGDDATSLNTVAPEVEAASVRPAIRASANASQAAILRSAEPSVSISTDGPGPAYHSGGRRKWILIGLAIAAGAGAAFAVSSLSKAGSNSASSSSISIGAPTVNVGHP